MTPSDATLPGTVAGPLKEPLTDPLTGPFADPAGRADAAAQDTFSAVSPLASVDVTADHTLFLDDAARIARSVDDLLAEVRQSSEAGETTPALPSPDRLGDVLRRTFDEWGGSPDGEPDFEFLEDFGIGRGPVE